MYVYYNICTCVYVISMYIIYELVCIYGDI